MPIRNPDGTIYKLYGPNKLMEQQDCWEKSDLTFHNFNWKPVILDDPNGLVVPPPVPMGPPPELIQTPQEPVPEPEEPPLVYHKPEEPQSDFVGLKCHCLPAQVGEEDDDLFMTSNKTIQYGVPFMCKVMPVTVGDILAAFDTDNERVSPGSIIYPQSYEKRWWRVMSIGEHRQDIYTLYCELSNQQPYFSSS